MSFDTRETNDGALRAKEIEDARAEGYAAGRAATRVRLSLLADELRMMPEKFVDAYGALCSGALLDGLEGRGVDSNPPVKPKVVRTRVRTGEKETRGLASRGKPPFPRGGADVRSPRLLAVKARIDRRLRSVAREIRDELEGKNAGAVRKCTRCKRFGEESWSWCPYDGAPMESSDPTV